MGLLFLNQDDAAVISSNQFNTMKLSLLCLLHALDLERHCVWELINFYTKFHEAMSEKHLHLIIRRCITIFLNEGGLSAVVEFWTELQVMRWIDLWMDERTDPLL